MAVRWLHRLGIVGMVLTAVLSITTPAHAEATVPLDGPLPISADDGPGCKIGAGRPYSHKDFWRFELRGGAGEFESLTLQFVVPGGAMVTRTVGPTDNPREASLTTDPGWALMGGSATASAGETFVLIEACPGSPTETEPLSVNAPFQPPTVVDRSPRALAPGTDVGATVTLGSTLVLAGVLLLVVRRRPRGRHRRRRDRPATS